MRLPTLIVVSGPPGSGKTTLAHEIARTVGCPAICRDEIKEGMVHATPGFTPAAARLLDQRTLTTFFQTIELLLMSGMTVIAEAAFQDRLWRPGLEPLAEHAMIRIIRCTADAAVTRARIERRLEAGATRPAHDDHGLLQRLDGGAVLSGSFVPISLTVPTILVDTTNGYAPDVQDIVTFIDPGQHSRLAQEINISAGA